MSYLSRSNNCFVDQLNAQLKTDQFIKFNRMNKNESDEKLNDLFKHIIDPESPNYDRSPLKGLNFLDNVLSSQNRKMCDKEIFKKIPVGILDFDFPVFGFDNNTTIRIIDDIVLPQTKLNSIVEGKNVGISPRMEKELSQVISLQKAVEFLTDKKVYIDEMIQQLFETKQKDPLFWENFDLKFESQKFFILMEMNLSDIVLQFYNKLKLSPFAVPYSLDDIFRKELEQNFKEENIQYFFKKKLRMERKMKKRKMRRKLERVKIDSSFKKDPNNVFQNYYEKFNNKFEGDKAIWLSFMRFVEKLFQTYFYEDLDLLECLAPLTKYSVGNSCPIIFKDFIVFLVKEPNSVVDLKQLFKLMLGYSVNDIDELIINIENFIDQLYLFSSLEIDKKFESTHQVLIMDYIKNKFKDYYREITNKKYDKEIDPKITKTTLKVFFEALNAKALITDDILRFLIKKYELEKNDDLL